MNKEDKEMVPLVLIICFNLFIVVGLHSFEVVGFWGAVGYFILISIAEGCIAIGIYELYMKVSPKGKKMKEQEQAIIKANEERARRQRYVEFYDKCRQNGITDLGKQSHMEKARILSAQLRLNLSDELINEYFNLGEDIREEARKNEEQKRIRDIKSEETKQMRINERFMYLYGLEKRKAMFLAMAKEEEDNIKGGQALSNLQSAFYEKESSWAVWGGIAEGLAGPAAGVATAMDIQQKNAEIRERNAQIRNDRMLTGLTLKGKEIERAAEGKRNELIRRANEIKLVADCNSDEALQMLGAEIEEVKITKSGSVTIKVAIRPETNITIYEDVKAVLDGSFAVRVLKGSQLVGVANFVLPVNGAYTPMILEGITVRPDDVKAKKSTYKYEIVPNKLWYIEK